MTELRTWFEPLLWILGTATAIIAFVKLCKPFDKFVRYPSTADERLDKIEELLEKNQKAIIELQKASEKQQKIELSLLHDAIIQIYNNAKNIGVLHNAEYVRAVELYKENGQSDYIDSIMTQMEDMWKEGQTNGNK